MKAYVRRDLDQINMRTGPGAGSSAKTLKVLPGAFLGNIAERRQSGTNFWLRLDYKDSAYVWILENNTEPEYYTGDGIYTRPGVAVPLLISADSKSQAVIPKAPQGLIGTLQRSVKGAGGKEFFLVRGKGFDQPLYVDSALVHTGRRLSAFIDIIAQTDQRTLVHALTCQDSISRMKKAGHNTAGLQKKLDNLMAGYVTRQKRIKQAQQEGEINIFSRLDAKVQKAVDAVKGGLSGVPDCGCHGVGAAPAVPVWLLVTVAVLVVVGLSAISIQTYKWIFESKPDKAAAFDESKIREYRKCLEKATTPEQVAACDKGLQKDIDDHTQKQFEEGEEKGAQKGLFDSIGKSLPWIAVAMIGGTIFQSTMQQRARK